VLRPEAVAPRLRQREDLGVVDDDGPRRRYRNTRDEVEERRLPGAAPAFQDRAGRRGQRQVLDVTECMARTLLNAECEMPIPPKTARRATLYARRPDASHAMSLDNLPVRA